MDIDLLAKMVKEAILDHEAVTLPGVGSFVAELMPSTFSDKGYTIHPPYRRLYFSPRQGTDTLLVDLYTAANAAEGVDTEKATRILTEFLAEMKEVLKVRKTVVFPGLGRLRATRENHFFFVADEDLDIYPEGLGLAPVSLKTHVETPDEVASAVAGLANLMAEPEEEISPRAALGRNDKEGSTVVEEIPGQVGNDGEGAEVGNDGEGAEAGNDGKESEEEISPRAALGRNDKQEAEAVNVEPKPRRRWWKVILIILGAVLLLLLVYALVGRLAPEVLDPLLYSPEELEILRY